MSALGVERLSNVFDLVTVAALRFRQLQNGARPRVEAGAHKLIWVALLEVRAGMVSFGNEPEPAQGAQPGSEK
jgi:DNA-directed RNA polymerase omega subunit